MLFGLSYNDLPENLTDLTVNGKRGSVIHRGGVAVD